jgi:hypothetical protein
LALGRNEPQDGVGIMPHPSWVHGDFNGLLADDLLCLAHQDTITDQSGRTITLRPGLELTAFDPDIDDDGRPVDLVASGVVEPSPEWAQCVGSRWALRIDARGIYHVPADPGAV